MMKEDYFPKGAVHYGNVSYGGKPISLSEIDKDLPKEINVTSRQTENPKLLASQSVDRGVKKLSEISVHKILVSAGFRLAIEMSEN